MPTHALMSTVKPLAHMRGAMTERLQFPQLLGKISKTNKCWRLLKEVALHLKLKISGDKHEVRREYMNTLVRRLTDPLLQEGANAIPSLIEMLDEYYLSKDDWQAMLELSMD